MQGETFGHSIYPLPSPPPWVIGFWSQPCSQVPVSGAVGCHGWPFMASWIAKAFDSLVAIRGKGIPPSAPPPPTPSGVPGPPVVDGPLGWTCMCCLPSAFQADSSTNKIHGPVALELPLFACSALSSTCRIQWNKPRAQGHQSPLWAPFEGGRARHSATLQALHAPYSHRMDRGSICQPLAVKNKMQCREHIGWQQL